MKSAILDIGATTLPDLISSAADNDIVFLSDNGTTRFALVPADDFDQEIMATRSNTELMKYLTDAAIRARTELTKTLEQLRQEFGE